MLNRSVGLTSSFRLATSVFFAQRSIVLLEYVVIWQILLGESAQ
jgi:hypothetical protein